MAHEFKEIQSSIKILKNSNSYKYQNKISFDFSYQVLIETVLSK